MSRLSPSGFDKISSPMRMTRDDRDETETHKSMTRDWNDKPQHAYV